MKVAVIGGRGFVGEAVRRELSEDHEIVTIDPAVGGSNHVSADITVPSSLEGILEGFDAAVNLAGLSPMKQPRGVSYEEVHAEGASNVVEACESQGVERLVHMSALGADPESEIDHLRTKGEGERSVLESPLETTVFRPSIIFDHGNELVEMARRFAPTRVFPDLGTRIQPVYRGDLAEMFHMAVESEIPEDSLDVGGPGEMTIFDLAEKVYGSEGYTCHPLPLHGVISVGFQLSEFLPFIPYGMDQARFLKFDNTLEENDASDYVDLKSVEEWLSSET
ncbi:MAG: NAD-dependent epimerase/dehydratase family protein [Candidatus Nanohaloarchaea archaeon]